MNKRHWLVAIGLFGAAAAGMASPPPLPNNLPLLNPPAQARWQSTAVPVSLDGGPDAIDWTSVLGRKSETNRAEHLPAWAPLSRDTTRDGATLREVVHWSNGQITETWKANRHLITQSPWQKGFRVSELGSTSSAAQLYPELAWVSPETYVGTRPVAGKEALFFRANQTASAGSPEADSQSETFAWLDAGTGLPVASYANGVMWLYEGPSASAERLSLPAEFQEALQAWQASSRRLVDRYKSAK